MVFVKRRFFSEKETAKEIKNAGYTNAR